MLFSHLSRSNSGTNFCWWLRSSCHIFRLIWLGSHHSWSKRRHWTDRHYWWSESWRRRSSHTHMRWMHSKRRRHISWHCHEVTIIELLTFLWTWFRYFIISDIKFRIIEINLIFLFQLSFKFVFLLSDFFSKAIFNDLSWDTFHAINFFIDWITSRHSIWDCLACYWMHLMHVCRHGGSGWELPWALRLLASKVSILLMLQQNIDILKLFTTIVAEGLEHTNSLFFSTHFS